MNWQTITDKKLKISRIFFRLVVNKCKIKNIQVTETTHTISRFPIQIPSLHLSPEEVTNIIQDSKSSKITSPNSLPQKIMKQIKKL